MNFGTALSRCEQGLAPGKVHDANVFFLKTPACSGTDGDTVFQHCRNSSNISVPVVLSQRTVLPLCAALADGAMP